MLAAESAWFLENAWLIPVVPSVAFALIILFGKRLPMKGAELGIASMATSLVLAAGVAYQWIQRVDDAHGGEGGVAHSLGGFGRSIRAAAETGEPFVEPVVRSWVWWSSGNVEFGIGQHIDGLSVMLLLLVAFISTLVQVYSLEYVRGDRRFTHFFAALTLFSAGMLVMVLAENMVQLILGWEIMGLCSFMLIGHWWEENANNVAALKAFWTVRVGDVGLLVGTAILFFSANGWTQEHLGESGFSIRALAAWALSGDASHAALLWGSVALFIACIGKSGQFPLHTWLPDAMAGPTPVSSLLHSSTMVVAGVFLVARLYPVFWEGLDIMDSGVNLIAVVGGITIVIAAALAFVQNDIKKVLAYSTVSQLGYMMMGLGVGAWTPAVFHIFTHAFFKCCLFLCAGSVSHSGSHHSFDMRKDMGGLARKMPWTAAAWIVSTAALAGIPFFSGFFSKDEIIDNAHHNGYTLFFAIGLIGAFMTAAYMTRATYLTFFGTPRGAAAGVHDSHDAHADAHDTHAVAHDAHGHDAHDAHAGPHESPWLIRGPIQIQAVQAIIAGYLNAPAKPFETHRFTHWVEPRAVVVADAGVTSEHMAEADAGHGTEAAATEGGEHHAAGCGYEAPSGGVCYFPAVSHAEFEWRKAVPSIVLVLLGIATSAWVMLGLDRERFVLKGLTRRFAPARWGHGFLVNKYYLDDLYEKVVVRGISRPIAKGAYWINQNVLDGVVNGAGLGSRRVAQWVYRNVDQRVVDGAVNASGAAARGTGGALQPVQSGKVNQYGALLFGAAAIGALVLVIINT